MDGRAPNESSAKRGKSFEVIKLVAVLATCAFLVWMNWPRHPVPPAPPVPEGPVSIEGAALRGDPRAAVVLVEWSDYECPFCGKAERDVLPALEERYIRTGKVQVVFFHLPLALHPHAQKAAEAAVCAGRQGRFWAMHDALFRDQGALEEPSLLARAEELELNSKRFAACLAGEAADVVRTDARRAETLGLRGTPAFLIGIRQPDDRLKIIQVIRGARPLEEFVKAIDTALGQVRGTASLGLKLEPKEES